MGVMDWFKRGVGEMMIARPDDAKAQVVWKHPDKTIPMKSQLTVEADEKAVFFRDGKIVEVLDAGRHTLDSSNLPFLSNLVDSFTGGDVFIAEVFFVNVREHTGLKFGGRIGHVEDPKSGVPVECMVHGEFSFRVTDPEQLITGLVGTGRAESYTVRSWMKEQVLKVIRDRIGRQRSVQCQLDEASFGWASCSASSSWRSLARLRGGVPPRPSTSCKRARKRPLTSAHATSSTRSREADPAEEPGFPGASSTKA